MTEADRVWNEYYSRWQGVETNSPTAGSRIHHTAWVAPWVTYGRNVTIGPNCSIGWEGFGYEQAMCGECSADDTACPPCPSPIWKRRDHDFGVVIGDDVEIGAGVTIDRGRYRHTVIGRGTKIDANVFIAHNVEIGEDCLIIANSQISGSCEIGNRCHIGPAAMLTDHVKVGHRGRCGLGAVVIRDVPAGVTVVGNPARDIQERRRAKIAEGMGDGSDDLQPAAEPLLTLPEFISELEQRQNAARKGWMKQPLAHRFYTTPRASPSLRKLADDHPGSHGDIDDGSWSEVDWCSATAGSYGIQPEGFAGLPNHLQPRGGGELEQRQRAMKWPDLGKPETRLG